MGLRFTVRLVPDCPFRQRSTSRFPFFNQIRLQNTSKKVWLSDVKDCNGGGLLPLGYRTKEKLPALNVDALIKPAQFDNWVRSKKLQFSLHGQNDGEEEVLEFQVDSGEKVATGTNAPNVRVRTIKSAVVMGCNEKLDVLLVAVKAYDSAGVVRELRARNRHLLKDDALCVLLQNGLGEVPQDGEEGVGDQWQLANGVTFVGGRVLGFGKVLTSGLDAGMTYLAPFAGSEVGFASERVAEDQAQLWNEPDAKMKAVAQVFLAAGIRCEVLEASKMQGILWRKLIVNAAINPLASLLDAPNSSVASSEGSRRCVNMVVQEALAVAQCEQIPLSCTQKELVEDILEVARNTGTNVCSMLADLRRGSRTEIDAITGRIVAGGKRHGIATPTNELLLSLIKALEDEGTRKRSE
ncbi:hypothetical protein PF008_g19327 [Phytophthora fragariae]|uniref:2-dehydropantoate 2-reductase n=1 Tax=Phytophthora fragariae TaxID=53985 RepID=A0A6G0R2Q4_9STRA|nr:hypothetical protein PF008_g19327 [Phytophthora fragariae]